MPLEMMPPDTDQDTTNQETPDAVVREVEVALKDMPPYSVLDQQIRELEQACSWMERRGRDWIVILGAFIMLPGCILLLAKDGTYFQHGVAFVLLGCVHSMLANAAGHIASHNALCESKLLGAFFARFFIEFIGNYSAYMGIHSHTKMHHPHTNIIGLGDSSTWRVPQLSREVYMLIAPLALPVITPVVAVYHLYQHRAWLEIPKFIVVAGSGFAFIVYLFVRFANFTIPGAIVFIFAYRALLAIPYVHINIFQHIGLPMYSPEHRPVRIYQMATGVLNLRSNPLLNFTMGHALISCHVEHHLFPRLSDHMCLNARPTVRKYLLDNQLPYNEDSYWNRFWIFWKDYDKLMVRAPQITHFIGVQ